MTNLQTLALPWKRIGSSLVAFLMLILLAFAHPDTNLQYLLFLLGVVLGSYYFTVEALEAVFLKHKINTDVLMVLAYAAAGVLLQFTDAMMLIFLYSITETLESVTVQRTRSMIQSLVQLVPNQALVVKENTELSVPIEELQVNDIIKVRAGERIPIDGTIIEGHSYIDESSITGEHLPIYKVVSDKVLAGTIVTDSVVNIRVDKLVQDSTVAKLIHLVEEAQKTKHPLHLLVNRFTRIYNPIIVFLSLLIFSYGILVSNIQYFGTMSAAFLVAGAPCALAIGTPVTVIAAIGSAGKNGILVKGGAALEQLADVDSFAFDKTGTLTFGNIDVLEVISFLLSKEELLAIAVGLESSSTHPFASALRRFSESYAIKNPIISNMKVIPGQGIEGTINDIKYFIGKLPSSQSLSKIDFAEIEKKYDLQSVSYSYISTESELLGIITFKDVLRKEAQETIQALQATGNKTYILTGDKRVTGLDIGHQLGIPDLNIYTDLTPSEKMEIINNLKKDSKLAMLGDGINDAPALASANLGIAMGVKGSDVAIETADISFMSEDISVLVKGIEIAKKMKAVLRQNIVVSIAIIVGVLAGVMIGAIDLPLAILAHEGSEVLIVGNSLRLLSKTQ